MTCELCNFKNPKCSVSAIILKDNKILLLKRNEEPFKDRWDLPGGYVQEMERLEHALSRELAEELEIEDKEMTFISSLPGEGEWKEKKFPVMAFFYLVDIGDQTIKLNKENSEYQWISLENVIWQEIAWDTNRDFIYYVVEKFDFDLERVKELVKQLDPNAEIKEQSLYKAIINGHLVQKKDSFGNLVGMGWIYKRQTMLRKQAVIEDMIVDETQRGKGIGAEILQELIDWAKEQNVEVIELTTNSKRIVAHKLYEKFGFQIHETDHMLLKL